MVRIFKRTIAVILATVTFFLACACTSGNAAEKLQLPMYNMESPTGHVPTQIDEFTEVAVHFNALGSFSEISLRVPSYSDNIGSINFSLYKWENNYTDTLNNEPVATLNAVDEADNAMVTLNFDSQEAGEYLFYVNNGKNGVAVYTYNEPYENFVYYRDQVISGASLEANVGFDDPENAGFGVPSDEVWVNYWQDGDIPEAEEIENAVDLGDLSLTDGLGRGFDEESPEFNEEKTVGIFYWPWHHKYTVKYACNLNNLMLRYPDAINDYYHEIWGSYGQQMAFWNEPIYGYYSSLDKWVIRQQAELLAEAGVDVIVLDCTNGIYTWTAAYKAIAEVYLEAREDGIDTPQIAFMCNFVIQNEIRHEVKALYTDFYSNEKYSDLWFRWKGKPLMLADKSALNAADLNDAAILDFFNFRRPDPFYFTKNTTNERWGWLSTYPQTLYKNEDGTVEQVTVGVAQNAYKNELVAMNDPRGAYGRSHTYDEDFSYSYTYGGEEITVNGDIENSTYYGLNFQEQWDYAIEADPEFIFVTGWNEWVANRYESWQGTENGFPDTFNDEYSRDIEPTKGDLKDYYYTQLAINIRRFKGVDKSEQEHELVTIRVGDSLSQWDNIKSYGDYVDDYEGRDATGYGNLYHAGDPVRNDIITSKVALDEDNVYFYVECREELTEPKGGDWMTLYIDTADSIDSYEGFEFKVKSNKNMSGLYVIENDNWVKLCELEREIGEKTIVFSIPRSQLGLTEELGASFSFKWTDDISGSDIMEVYTRGDAAPGSRFAYYYENDGTAGNFTRNPFDDVKYGKWYTASILYCYRYGYMAGVSENTFGYKENVNRAMFVTVLSKIDSADLSEYEKMSFADVESGKWYSNAIEWAYQNGYTSGTGIDAQGNMLFGRKADVSREQLATFFHTYTQLKGYGVYGSGEADLSRFDDRDDIHSWALDSMLWAVDVGLLSGTSDTTLSPRTSAPRSNIALMVMNYVEMVKSIPVNPIDPLL